MYKLEVKKGGGVLKFREYFALFRDYLYYTYNTSSNRTTIIILSEVTSHVVNSSTSLWVTRSRSRTLGAKRPVIRERNVGFIDIFGALVGNGASVDADAVAFCVMMAILAGLSNNIVSFFLDVIATLAVVLYFVTGVLTVIQFLKKAELSSSSSSLQSLVPKGKLMLSLQNLL